MQDFSLKCDPKKLINIPDQIMDNAAADCKLHTAHCKLHNAHCKLHTAHCKLHTAHCTLQNSQFTLYNSSHAPALVSLLMFSMDRVSELHDAKYICIPVLYCTILYIVYRNCTPHCFFCTALHTVSLYCSEHCISVLYVVSTVSLYCTAHSGEG